MQTVRRLFDYFQPNSYQLHFDFSTSKIDKKFSGSVTISGKQVTKNELCLHSKDLIIKSIEVNDKPASVSHRSNDELVINSPHVGQVTVKVEFSGQITDAMHGIYPCYFEANSQPDQLIATQFESHHAREAFPCVDEPEAKATFDVTITAPAGTTVLGNMPISSTSASDNSQLVTFNTTPRMSTYLLAFVIGDLQQITGRTKRDVEVGIFATKAHDKSALEFALTTAIKSIEFFEDYFEIDYPLPKSDHVALPDFSSGAMENWGLITYRESCLLIDKDSAPSSREQVASVIAHEVSHQWFGNLVTMKWWDDLWLNESFANLMEYVAVDSIYPEWNIWNVYATQESISALRRDRLAGVQSVKTTVNHPDEISTLFDPSIVYAKGGRLLKMLWNYIGEDAWRRGLQIYFKNNLYKNTSGDDLWMALSESSGKDVAKFMENWLNQPGYPVVDLQTAKNGYKLSQKRFVIGEASEQQNWPIPLAADVNIFPDVMLDKHLVVDGHSTLPLLNQGNSGHYITNYDADSLELIKNALINNQLSTVDRLSLLHELSLLSYTELFDTGELVHLLSAYKNETEEAVWGIIAMVINELKRFVEDDERAESNLKQLARELSLPSYNTLGPDQKPTDSNEDIKLRAIIVSLLSYSEYQPLIEHYLQIFRNSQNLNNLPGETRVVIFGVAARFGNKDDFERLTSLHQQTANPELRDDLVGGITSTRDETQIRQLIDRLTDTGAIKPQDLGRWYVSLLRNRYARESTWQWLKQHWSWIEQTFKGDKSYDQLVRYSAMILTGDDWLNEYINFFESKKSDPALRRNIDVGITDIKARTRWLNNDKNSVTAALDR